MLVITMSWATRCRRAAGGAAICASASAGSLKVAQEEPAERQIELTRRQPGLVGAPLDERDVAEAAPRRPLPTVAELVGADVQGGHAARSARRARRTSTTLRPPRTRCRRPANRRSAPPLRTPPARKRRTPRRATRGERHPGHPWPARSCRRPRLARFPSSRSPGLVGPRTVGEHTRSPRRRMR